MLHARLEHRVGTVDLDIDLQVEAGRCVALAGPSGAGKSTVLSLIAGTSSLQRGTITYAEQVWVDTASGTRLAPEQRRCGYVLQHYALFPHLSAARNVAFGLRSLPRRERRTAALEMLDRFGIAALADSSVQTMSGGERQRVALARALAPRPSALLLDEPLGALDARTRAAAGRELAAALHALEVPVILVTHDFNEAAFLGDEIGVIDRGKVVQRGTASELAATPASAFVADFAGAVVLFGTARPVADELTAVDLEGGGVVATTDRGAGRVALSVYPWEISIREAGAAASESTQNALPARVTSLTSLGNRVRVGLAAGQPLTAEVTSKAADELHLVVGEQVLATWKATATRLVPL